MKIKKLTILLISIIVPLTITILIGLYSYGTIGDWTGNQEKYINELFYKDQTNEKSIENYLKFNSEKYRNNSDSVKLYKDYKASNLETIDAVDGTFKIEGLNFSLYTLLSQDETYPSYHYDFFFSGVDNTIVNPRNITVIFVEEEDNSTTNLKLAIDQFSDEFITENEQSVYSTQSSKLTANVLFTTGSGLIDTTGKGKTNSKGELETPYLYSSGALRHQFIVSDEAGDSLSSEKTFKELSSCSFAIIELVYDESNNAEEVVVLTTGYITDIEKSADDYVEKHPDMLLGYGLDSDKALTNSGYFGFIWPTILLHAGIAAAITGVFGFLFYKTWTYEEPNQNKKKNVR